MRVTQRAFTHVSKLDGALAAGIHEPVATLRVEFGSGDDLGQLLHVGRLDVDDIEALVLNVKVPQIDPQVITGNERLSITVYGNAVDVISMSIGIGASRDSGHNSIMVCHAR